VVLNGSVDKRGDMVSKFFKQVSRHFANDMAVVSPNAELLAHQPADGLKKWKEMTPEQRKLMVDFGEYDASLDPAPPTGGLRFNVFARAFTRDGGTLAIYKTKVTRSLEAGRDHLWLTAAEAASLASLKVPETIVDRICRHALVDLVRVGGNGNPRKAEDVLSREMALTVIETKDGLQRLRISGAARLATHDVGSGARPGEPKKDDYKISGEALFDTARKAFIRLDFVAFSETGHYDEIAEKVLPFGVAIELSTGQTPSDLLPPAFYSASYFK
jgi:hypothetical protein